MTFDFSKKLFVSTIAEDCAAAAREHSLGLEIAEFCYAPNMDTDLSLIHISEPTRPY